jgi:pyruvate/2-oxoglutarate dehydrogenase complex dihydrolipoamide dehydrogenase (E3) component
MSHIENIPQLQPFNEPNQRLKNHVHPSDWSNPVPDEPYHLVVIGAGTAGLVTAAGAAGLGARVALIERELMGGDCLNTGCVPSKAVIASARAAANVREAAELGVTTEEPNINFEQVMERMRSRRADISPADSAKRFKDLGVDVFFGSAKFVSGDAIEVDSANGTQTLNFKKAVIASGARAAAPPIPGLESVPYMTNETVFSMTKLPQRLAVLGGGPIGCELAQSFARLGSEVFLLERGATILGREDADAAEIVQKQMIADGVNLLTDTTDMEVARFGDDQIRISALREGSPFNVDVDSLLVAVGRAPNVDQLNLEAIDVAYDRKGVQVNDNLQTTNPKIYAAGDVCSQFKFTHAADFQARIVIQNALFSVGPIGKKRASDLIIPWATYTSPEVAHVGLYPDQAREVGMSIDTYIQYFEDVDRAILEGKEEGFVKVHTRKGSDKIIGATIVAENAGDMISEITLAMKNGVGLGGISGTIHPYPTNADAIRKLGDQFNKTKLTPMSRNILNFLRWLNVGD